MANRPLPPPLTPSSPAPCSPSPALAGEGRGGGNPLTESPDATPLSPEVTLMRLLLAGTPAAALPHLLRDDPTLAALAAAKAPHLAKLEALIQAGAEHAPGTGLDATAAMFDRLVAISPEAAVAAYSLGDPATLKAATAELVTWLDGQALLADRPRILDLGCGIGRVAAALAPRADQILGLDISAAMIAEARARHAAIPNLRFATTPGRDLAALPDQSFDLLLAVDVFPYLVQAGAEAAMLTEAARVIRRGGQVVILNWSYGDAAPLADLAPRCGLHLLAAPTRPLTLWDATAFRLGLAPAAPP